MIEEKDIDRVEGDSLVPGTWGDLFLYLSGGFGLFLMAGLGLALFITEITFTVTVIVMALNVIFLSGSVYLLGIRRGKISWNSLGISPPVWETNYWWWGIFLVVALFPIRGAVGILIEKWVYGNLNSLELRSDLLAVDNLPQFAVLLVGAGILAPMAEELFFRGLLYNWFRQRSGVGVSVWVSSLLFGLAHFDSVTVMVSSLMMGVVLALAFERTKSLWVSIFIHVANNSIALSFVFLLRSVERFLPEDFLTGG